MGSAVKCSSNREKKIIIMFKPVAQILPPTSDMIHYSEVCDDSK